MQIFRRTVAAVMMAALAWLAAPSLTAAHETTPPQQVLCTWFKLALELVRHTATYSPPVASRTFAYLGVTAYEAVASGSGKLRSLAGQLNALEAVPPREAGQTYDEAVVIQAALALAVQDLFANTGPTGQRAMAKMEEKLSAAVSEGLPADVVARSVAYGRAVAEHVLKWSRDDGGAVVENMGFPREYELTPGPAHWVPTNVIAVQQKPLLPGWGKNRAFAMPDGKSCSLPPPPEYSEDKSSEFYKQALEVYQAGLDMTPEQRAISRFWSDDAMLSPTPPGHWISIVIQIFERDGTDLERSADALARVAIGMADAFIGCWDAKFQYDLVRPVTYIRRVIDPKWEPLLTTPPFPEYPSGHSTQSGAAAEILTQVFGDNFAFEDATHIKDGIQARGFKSFRAAAEEAAISRFYGGIHFRAAIEQGVAQGRCIGAYVNALRTWR
jgi:hypothetical protein